jgi:hypothetical protein
MPTAAPVGVAGSRGNPVGSSFGGMRVGTGVGGAVVAVAAGTSVGTRDGGVSNVGEAGVSPSAQAPSNTMIRKPHSARDIE